MKCKAVTKEGKPCRANALAGSDYCRIHQHLAEDGISKTKPDGGDEYNKYSTPRIEKISPPVEEPIAAPAASNSSILEREVKLMDEKKNIGFVPGLALLLSVLALVLIAINLVTPSPSEETLEQALDIKIQGLQNQIMQQFQYNLSEIGKSRGKLVVSELRLAKEHLTDYAPMAGDELQADIQALSGQIDAMLAKLQAKVGSSSTVAAAPAPVAPSAEKEKKEVKEKEVKKAKDKDGKKCK